MAAKNGSSGMTRQQLIVNKQGMLFLVSFLFVFFSFFLEASSGDEDNRDVFRDHCYHQHEHR